jgi:hypothetical protein
MIRPDDRLLDSLCRIQGNTDFDRITEWIAASLERERIDSDAMTEHAAMLLSCGKRLVLKEFLTCVAESRQILKRSSDVAGHQGLAPQGD